MKHCLFTLAVALLMTSSLVGSNAEAKPANPGVLNSVLDQVRLVKKQGARPVVIMDLDDTLIDTGERNLRIFQEFAAQASVQRDYPADAAKISAVKLEQIKYLTDDTLNGIGVTDKAVQKLVSEFWLARFFTNAYCGLDVAILGAPAYARALERAGAKIVYLTGRDAPRMYDGTVQSLKANSFPLVGAIADLIMKPDAKMDDLTFKKDAFARIQQMGEVVAVFENEPANVNAMADAFPSAIGVFLDTKHSPKPDVPHDRIAWVKNFTPRAVSIAQASELACQEAERVKFQFETSCQEDFDQPTRATDKSFVFQGNDGSGDCGILVEINRRTGKAKSQVRCD